MDAIRWELDQNTFNNLLAKLDLDANRAGEKYEAVRLGMAKYFECRGCAPAFDLADETINRVARRLAEGAAVTEGSINAYFYGVARNVFHEHLRSRDRDQSPIDSLPPHAHPFVDPAEVSRRQIEEQESKGRLACLHFCVHQLPPETRVMMLSYYEGKQGARIANRKRIAEELGMPMNGLRIRVHRVREKLEMCLINCLGRPAA